MTTADDGQLPATGMIEPGSEHDPEAAEAYAESVSIDPSHDEINEYLKIAGGTPLDEQSNTPSTDGLGT
jgi:hypothetical protein